jgi:hypothetical protein
LTGVFEKDGLCSLPCEVVLAAIEVKKTLDSSELRQSITNAQSVRLLRPYGTQVFTAARRGGATLNKKEHRCFYSLVAHDSDLVSGHDWAEREWVRVQREADGLGVSPDVIDRLVVLDRGMVNTVEGLGTTDALDAIVGQWFIHLWNHLDREAKRRPALDPDIYTRGVGWRRLQ